MQNADDRPLGCPITPEVVARWRARGWGKTGESVPVVDWRDLKIMWEMYQEPGHENRVGIGMAVFENACSPGANILAISHRLAQVIWTLLMMQENAQKPPDGVPRDVFPDSWRDIFPGGKPDDAAFRVAAKAPVEWLEPGVRTSTPESYYEDLIQRIRDERDKTAA